MNLKRIGNVESRVKWEEKEGVLYVSIFRKPSITLYKNKYFKPKKPIKPIKHIVFSCYQEQLTEKVKNFVCEELKQFSTVDQISFETDFEINFLTRIIHILSIKNELKILSISNLYMLETNFESIKMLKIYFYFLLLVKEKQIAETSLFSVSSIDLLANTKYLTKLRLGNACFFHDPNILLRLSKCMVLNQIKEFALHLGKQGGKNKPVEEYLFTRVFHCLYSVNKVNIMLYYFCSYKYSLFSMITYQALTSGILTNVDEATIEMKVGRKNRESSFQLPTLKKSFVFLRKQLSEIFETDIDLRDYERSTAVSFKKTY
eukprot:snap_masked-scaffold_25-processed-gene-2.41-mRNA-1 protein AED:1.00 eAED:1.00 QI:0/0/0/0/1/1/2/0/316